MHSYIRKIYQSFSVSRNSIITYSVESLKSEQITSHWSIYSQRIDLYFSYPQPVFNAGLSLGTYDYTIAYKPRKKHENADALSRLPLPDQPLESHEPAEVVLLMETLRSSPVTAQDIRRWTDCDQLLSKVRGLIQHGWENLGGEEMKPYHRRYTELSVQDGCILWGYRVVVPAAG